MRKLAKKTITGLNGSEKSCYQKRSSR